MPVSSPKPACTAMIFDRTMTFGIDLSQRHSDQVPDHHVGAGRDGLNPEPEVAREDREDHQQDDQDEKRDDDGVDVSHIVPNREEAFLVPKLELGNEG